MNAKRDKRRLKGAQAVLTDIIFSICLVLILLFFVKQASVFRQSDEAKRSDSEPLTKAKKEIDAEQGVLEEPESSVERRSRIEVQSHKEIQSHQEVQLHEEMRHDEKLQLIDINTAEAAELKKLHGIGDALAERIVEYRKKHGKFKKISDLKRVNGIGERKFEMIKDDICVK